MKGQNGFTFIELVVVVAIIATLFAIATLNFKELNDKHTVESNIKEIYTVLMRERSDASKTNTPRLVTFAANRMQTGSDIDGDDAFDGTPSTYTYPRFSLNFVGKVTFDRRGLTNDQQTISITGYSVGHAPLVDCIVVAATRINMGKMTGGICAQR